ncbi:MAG TPA: 3',5'-nucleoside bisphosphate phosphatase [Accumulibacter sp.]|nr:3',5'-nucleoside bisphosphate phosphatase [Accumulibacter sp.]
MRNCDLHCHSLCSDGLLPAETVVERAVANGVEMLALTDHDDLAGLPAARATATALGLDFVNGVEISTEWQGMQIHIVGLAVDATDPGLIEGLAGIRSGRIERARRMSADLERVGIFGAFDGAMRLVANPNLISRSHFGRFLVNSGVRKDVHSVFESFLVPGKPGYVAHRWATLDAALNWIHTAGGIAVIAHPGRYKLSRTDLRRFFSEFKDLGGRAIEVQSGSHSPEQVEIFSRLAREFAFLASRGSDFHGLEESYVDLGQLPPLPDGLTPVWEAFSA